MNIESLKNCDKYCNPEFDEHSEECIKKWCKMPQPKCVHCGASFNRFDNDFIYLDCEGKFVNSRCARFDKEPCCFVDSSEANNYIDPLWDEPKNELEDKYDYWNEMY